MATRTRRAAVVATLLALGLFTPGAVTAQQASYFHCEAPLTRAWTAPAVWAHIQSDRFNVAYNDCVEVNRVAGGARSNCVNEYTGHMQDCYLPAMLGYSIQQMVASSRQPGAVELPACWVPIRLTAACW